VAIASPLFFPIKECENVRGFENIRENRKAHERALATADHRKKK